MADLVDRYRDQVFGLCYRMLGHRQDAEDAAQETFTRALRNLRSWDSNRDFEPWLLAIAGNRCRTALSRRMRRPPPRPLNEPVACKSPDLQAAKQLAEEVELTRQRLAEGTPVVGIGLGAQILALAAGGGVESRELTLETLTATRTRDDALNGFLPQTFNQVVYMRDWPVVPAHATVLAIDNFERPAVWQVGENAFGFSGNPGIKLGMVEDLIMEFEEVPVDTAGQLEKLRALQAVLEDELVPIMTGLVQCTSLMSSPKAARGVGELDAQVI